MKSFAVSTEQVVFIPGMQVTKQGKQPKEVRDAGHLAELLDDDWTVIAQVTAPNAGSRPRATNGPIVLSKDLTKDQRRKLRENNQANSLVVPEKFRFKDGNGEPITSPVFKALCLAFPEKISARTGNKYSAMQIEVDSTKFCVLDQGDEYDKGVECNVQFVPTDNTAIASGYETKIWI